MADNTRNRGTRPAPRRNSAISAVTGRPMVLVLGAAKESDSHKDISVCPCGKKDAWCSECYGNFGDFIFFD